MRSWNDTLVRIIDTGWEIPGSRCRECAAVFHPERAYCPRCSSSGLEPISLAKEGDLVSFTQVHRASPESLIPAPYWLGLVRLDDGPVIELAGSVGLNGTSLRPGSRVLLTLEPITTDEKGADLVTYRFASAEESR